MSDILNEIVRQRRLDYESLTTCPISEIAVKCSERVDFRSFRAALAAKSSVVGEVAIIAEIKRGSPSKGIFASGLDAVSCAVDYECGGAAALSVLTEGRYFGGSIDDLVSARGSCGLPVLRKDFIATEYQVYETAIYADCMLLIARTLDGTTLKAYYDLATELKLDVLVEVFDEADIEKIAPYNFPLIGINHRNLATMEVDIDNSNNFARYFNNDQTIIAASGINSRGDIERIMCCGIKSFLVGESLSKSSDRVQFLRNLVNGNDS
ncbi:MAG: indole-3-glycerol phosphate synthase TrpC [Planctomycetaceae bacterium]|jgi:indole-3-glycerol phosphate synthase|nr:indole-3-glycerol phosphate synthase TrpC [Planctomycetaceae bacterium]